MANNLMIEMQNLLDEYKQEVIEATKEASKEAAEMTVNILQSTSPKKKSGRGKGKYARGWTSKRLDDGDVVYNKTNAGFTQLLEYGHVIRNQVGYWGRVRAIPHIARAAESGIQRFELGIRARLRG